METQTAKTPRRARGKLRVAALLEASSIVFAEKGYEAATMTEIAQRAGASIGSLYQFFPSKEALAETLANRYLARMAQELEDIAARVAGLRPARLADLLVDLVLKLRPDRDVAMAFSNSGPAPAESRRPRRHLIQTHVAAVLRAARPALSDQQIIASATVVTHLIKIVPALAAEEQGVQGLIAEARRMLTFYLERTLKL